MAQNLSKETWKGNIMRRALTALQQQVAGYEEATRSHSEFADELTLELLEALGYDPSDPQQVQRRDLDNIPFGSLRAADIVVCRQGKPFLLITCRLLGKPLAQRLPAELVIARTAAPEAYAIETNGVELHLFSPETHLGDSLSSLERIDLRNSLDSVVVALEPFCNEQAAVDANAPDDATRAQEIRELMNRRREEPSDAFVLFFAPQIMSGHLDEWISERFPEVPPAALRSMIREWIDRKTEEQPALSVH